MSSPTGSPPAEPLVTLRVTLRDGTTREYPGVPASAAATFSFKSFDTARSFPSKLNSCNWVRR